MSFTQSQTAIDGGFLDPVFDAQGVFARLLTAISRPGSVVDLGACCRSPAPLSTAQGALLLAMTDGDTPVFVEEGSEAMAEWLAFHTGARIGEPSEAQFAIVSRTSRKWLERLPLGTLAYPDRSATVLVEVESLKDGHRFTLEGPGINGTSRIVLAGLLDDFAEFRKANHALFPCGLDLVFTCGSELLALPRSTIVTEA
ncbi:MAG: phosphonate C-P lyase system protein PhnH [Fulvimarina manganoxydans]|uniref:phosphonate C-P lyase system protein PhnH n=1 Tax=Fulvimarina manganoxydans TaxID=937218 RepID=UPI00235375A1|nr:phosphonate C-P lyase system protein PhnH [Fulvimarina manganoxydans]MCK5930845.1 phosphonate C-P lyase system protein PhnH [Fulvimarina manganoxydans]